MTRFLSALKPNRSQRGRVGTRSRRLRYAMAGVGFAAVVATVTVGSTGAWFTGQVAVGQSATSGSLAAVSSFTAAKSGATSGQSTQLAWAAPSGLETSAGSAVSYLVKRNTVDDFSANSGAVEVYSGAARTAADTVESASLSEREFTDVAGGVSSDAMFAISAGKVFYWGSAPNWFAATGNPTALGGTYDDIVRLAPGMNHVCALSATAKVYCAGHNNVGQLGNGQTSTTSTYTLTEIPMTAVIPSSEKIVQVTSGESFSCALGSRGTMACWGLNTWGQLGDGTSTNRSSPVKVAKPGGSVHDAFSAFTPVMLSAGAFHTCAVKGSSTSADGVVTAPGNNSTVACWGRNNWAQLGLPTDDDSVHSSPIDLADPNNQLTGVRSISASHGVSCVLNDRTGAVNVACWGGGGLGLLGGGAAALSRVPIALPYDSPDAGALTASRFTGLVVSNDVACATRDEQYACWGQNQVGQLGRGGAVGAAGTYLKIGPLGDVRALAGSGAIRSIGASIANVCVVTQTGATACWGKGTNRTTAQGTVTTHQTAPVIARSSGGSYVPTLEATILVSGLDSNYSAAVMNGDVYYWGVGIVPNGATGSVQLSAQPEAAIVPGFPTGVRLLAGGKDHICGVVGDNELWCVGSNIEGQLGDGTTTSRRTAARVVDSNSVFAGRTIVDIDAGFAHTCALASDGQIGCWGRNNSSQLGSVSGAFVPRPVVTVAASPSSGPFAGAGRKPIDLATAGEATCAAKEQSGVACWGKNDSRQLGAGVSASTSSSSAPVDIVDVNGALAGGRVQSIDGSYMSFCLVSAAGKPHCWGRNSWGELGTGTTVTPLAALTPIAASNVYSGVTVGTRMGCGYTTTVIRCWGNNGFIELGRDLTGNANPPYTDNLPVADQDNLLTAGIVTVASGWQHTCVLSASKGVACWGKADANQTGQTSTANTPYPKAITTSKGVISGPSTRMCPNSAVLLDGATRCSLAPNRTYFYQVTYRLAGADNWVSAPATAIR